MKQTTLRLSLVALALAGIAACSGGGNSASTAVPLQVSTSPSNASLSASSTGLKLSLTINRANKHVSTKSSARRSPKYVSYNANGLQVTIVAGSATKVYNYDLDTGSSYCPSTSNNSYACTFTFPTLGPVETVSILEVDQEPTPAGDPTTGLSTGSFPANTNVLANGSTGQLTLTPGAISQVAIALNPVIEQFYDCEFFQGTGSSYETYGTNGAERVVVTGNAATSAILGPTPVDADGQMPFEAAAAPSASPTAQPFVDINGTIEPLLATSGSSHVLLLPMPTVTDGPVPPATGAYAQTANIPNTSYTNDSYQYSAYLAFQYDGAATPGPSPIPVTLSNQLSAPLPTFTGTPVSPPVTYAASISYYIAPVFATPVTATVASGGTQVFTGYDPLSPNDMTPSTGCSSLGSIASNGPLASGVQTFTFTSNTDPGTCTLTLNDTSSGIVSNTVTISVP